MISAETRQKNHHPSWKHKEIDVFLLVPDVINYSALQEGEGKGNLWCHCLTPW